MERRSEGGKDGGDSNKEKKGAKEGQTHKRGIKEWRNMTDEGTEERLRDRGSGKEGSINVEERWRRGRKKRERRGLCECVTFSRTAAC